jgi:hypothetical protein
MLFKKISRKYFVESETASRPRIFRLKFIVESSFMHEQGRMRKRKKRLELA